MVSIPEWWKPQHVEAYRAWKQDDQNRLIKACEPVIKRVAHGFAQDSRRGVSDELRQPSRHERFERGRKAEAALGQDGLREAKEVADFDELYQAGCQAVLEVKDRYDPEKKGTPFQVFAYKRIRGAMLDLLNEKRKLTAEQASSDSSAAATQDPSRQFAALVEKGEFIEEVALFLSGYEDLDDWRDFIQNAPFATVRFFWWFLYQYADDLDPRIGEVKRKKMLSVATIRYFVLRFEAAADSGAEFVEISGPAHMETIERQRKADETLPVKIDDKPMGRLLRRGSGKKPIAGDTIKRWRERMAEAGAPPFMKEDGSFTLKSEEEFTAFAEYFMRIATPRMWWRIQRRRQQRS